MKRLLFLFVLFLFATPAAAQMSKLNPLSEPSADEFRKTFEKGPGRDFSTGPLWVWNDLLTDEQIRGTLRDLAGQHVKQVWVHPRPGLATPYLSEEWFRLWNVALDEAEKLDMNVWIYDENSYPSGFAGGFVPKELPDARIRGIEWKDGKRIFREGAGGAWFGGTWYVDLLKKGVTEKFIEITNESYKKHVGTHFGKRVPGIFTDEPHLMSWGGYHWNEEIPLLFEKRFGYKFDDDALKSLFEPVGDWKKVRHDYNKLLLELFIERWSKPNFAWCEANNMEWTGHYWEHGWPGTGSGPDNMAMYAWHQRPAIDILMNQYNEGVNAQFGNVRSVKEVASVINQLGHSRNLCELYGAGGWDLTFEDMKRQADWLQVLGVNTINEHLSYITLRGARKRDHPQSFSYHSAWFEGYHVLADYNTRLQYALSQGRQVNRVLVIEPTTTAWMYQRDGKLNEIGNSFQKFITDLEKANVEYDLGSEDILARIGKIEDGNLVVGKAKYNLVVIPDGMENIESTTLKLLVEFRSATEGVGIFGGESLNRVDGVEPNEIDKIQLNSFREFMSSLRKEMLEFLNASRPETPLTTEKLDLYRIVRHFEEIGNAFGGMSLIRDDNSQGLVFHHRRELGNQEILFLANVDKEHPSSGVVKSNALFEKRYDSVELWSPETGKQEQYPYETIPGEQSSPTTQFRFYLPPCGSQLFVITKGKGNPEGFMETGPMWEELVPNEETPAVRRLGLNVMPIDFVDVKVGDERRNGIYFHKAAHWVFEKNGKEIGLTRNPWDNGVQFKDEWITKKFPEGSGFTLTYRFNLAKTLSNPLYIVIERPDLYKITCNNEPVSAKPGDWHLDKAFLKVDISKAAKSGENEVVLVASPMTVWHEIEPAYLIGDFSLSAAEKGFIVLPPQPLKFVDSNSETKTSDVLSAHSSEIEKVSWLSGGVKFSDSDKDDTAPFLVFDLGKETQIDAIRIWNYNERNLTKRGVNALVIGMVDTPDQNTGTTIRQIVLDKAPGREETTAEYPKTVFLKTENKPRYVRFDIHSNHSGTSYPMTELVTPDDNAFVGLSEVQFLKKDADGNLRQIPNVKVVKASSELVARTHDRKAAYLVDGSGLVEGISPEPGAWTQCGMPFYSEGVSYSQVYDIDRPDSEHKVRLGRWAGATAKIVVNGKTAGYVVSDPWEVDITKQLVKGKNTIEVVVIGTPKNLLGPHHAGKVRGTAWPGMFWRAPETGPPPGSSYDVIDYGLFEPFTVHRAD